jgi:hypothetical protein
MMNPLIGRFGGFDPLAEMYPDVSPYAYCYNNPMRFIDPSGMRAIDKNDEDEDKDDKDKDKDKGNAIDGGTLSEVMVIAKRRVAEPISGVWGHISYFLFGRTMRFETHYISSDGKLKSSYTTYNVDSQGYITGLAPIMGFPPLPTFKGGTIFIKGFGYVNKIFFHTTMKKYILKAAGNFEKIVGKNPDILVNKAGEIILKARNSSKTMNTGLKASDFLE